MTAKNKSERFKRLISHGFFAPELPPCFVSNDLARYRESIWKKIVGLPPINGTPRFHKYFSEPSWFHFPRYLTNDRKHGALNPISFLALSKAIADNFVALRTISRKSIISSSPLVFDWRGSRAMARSSIDLRDDFRVDLSSRTEKYVSCDIRAFYHSIYTHAIPWAIYSKPWAKINRGANHYGNLIDLLCRNAQDGQTIGLPVGPDTSRLVAEVIASAVDKRLMDSLNLSSHSASRYVDDFTIACADGKSGESIIAAVRSAAEHFELELNSEKSEVIDTSSRHSIGWKQAIRKCIPEPGSDLQDFQQFHYEIGQVCAQFPDINVEKFALQNARIAFASSTEWRKNQSLLINSYKRNTTLVSILVEILILRQATKGDVEVSAIQEFLSGRILALTERNATGELIWLLFLALRLNITLPSNSLPKPATIENAYTALLIAVMANRGLIAGPYDLSPFSAHLKQSSLRSGMWLFSYQAARDGLVPGNNDAFIVSDDFFSLILERDVSFLSVENGFTSLSSALRSLRGENILQKKLRDDYFVDFDIDLDEFDEDVEDFEDGIY